MKHYHGWLACAWITQNGIADLGSMCDELQTAPNPGRLKQIQKAAQDNLNAMAQTIPPAIYAAIQFQLSESIRNT